MSNSAGSTANLTEVHRSRSRRSGSGNMDLPFMAIVLILLVIGMLTMFSASYATAISEGKSGAYYAIKQAKMAGLGLVAMFVLSYLDYHFFQKLWVSGGVFVVSLILLVLVLVRGSASETGVTRWLVLGPINFQPSEVVKFAVIIFFSMLIAKNYNRMDQFFVGIVPFLGMLGVVAGLLILEPHLSGTILVVLIGLTLIFVGGAKVWQLGLTGTAVVVMGAILVLVKKNYFLTRITTWRDPFNEAWSQDETWQTCQSLIAIGSGGLFGLGLGSSRQKHLYLPETKNDFVFSVFCEEFGFVGAVVIIILFVLLIVRGFYVAAYSKDKFGMLLAVGLTAQIGYQAFLNIAVVSNFIPNTGITLPFFSYGGTALVMQLAQMGILLNVSRQATLDT